MDMFKTVDKQIERLEDKFSEDFSGYCGKKDAAEICFILGRLNVLLSDLYKEVQKLDEKPKLQSSREATNFKKQLEAVGKGFKLPFDLRKYTEKEE